MVPNFGGYVDHYHKDSAAYAAAGLEGFCKGRFHENLVDDLVPGYPHDGRETSIFLGLYVIYMPLIHLGD